MEGDIVMMVGDEAESMFFLACGTMAAYDEDGEELTHVEDGGYFGELTMVYKEKRYYSVVAIELSEVYILRYDDFKRCIEPYPEAEDTLMEYMKARKDKMDKVTTT